MNTPEPPAGSEHYREGWRHGYEQAAIDRERSDEAVRPADDRVSPRAVLAALDRAGPPPDTGQVAARESLPFVPDEMWLTADWGVIESDGAGAWRTIENALPVEQLPAVRLLLIPAVDEQDAGSSSGDTGQARDDIRGWLHEQIEAGGDPMLARVLDALNEPAGDTVQAPDEMEEHFVDANERLGEALVEIGMTIGLPRPTAQFHWGAPEILARIAEYDRIQVWVCDVEGHAEIPCRRCHLGTEGKPTPLYRYSGPRRTGQVADPKDDLARLDSMIAAAPADYPGLPLIRRHRDEVRALLGTDITPEAGQ